MNEKQTIPVIARTAPPLPMGVVVMIGVAVFFALKWIFSAKKDTETKPEAMPGDAGAESSRKTAETTAFRQNPAEISVRPATIPVPSAHVPAVIPPVSVPPVPKISASVPAPQKIVTQAPPPPIKTKFITREDMATVFQRGARTLTRSGAVAALKRLGFGKSAAYEALLEDGHFASWLQFAPDGIITWRG
jgi:hypothetical protein